MKSTVISLLIVAVFVGIINLLATLGVIGGGGGANAGGDYLVLSPQKMDELGFASIAEEDGMKPDENGAVTLKREDIAKDPRAYRPNMVPRSIEEVEKQGYTFIAVTSDNHYIFRK
ncbi:MAG: hypothetical protein ACKVJU_07470 [Verrucomicrobiales bacterium]